MTRAERYAYTVQVDTKPAQDIDTPFVSLDSAGNLTIRKAYAWDGPSGPTIDTKSFMRGSLVHDALYQLMRLGKLDSDKDLKSAASPNRSALPGVSVEQ